MTGDLRPVIADAVARFGSPTERIFTTDTFAMALRDEFALRQCPDHAFCASVLDRLEYVARLSGAYLWLYHPDAQLVPDRETEARR
jgi:hypothetical protein